MQTHLHDPVLVPALREAVTGLGWVAGHRRVVPDGVERGLQLLDGR